MAEVTDVDIASGIPTGGTGTVPTLSKTNTVIGAVTETAPATDIASSGLNGRLQRVAQRLTSMIALLPAALGAGGGLKIDGSGTAVPVTATNATAANLKVEATLAAAQTLATVTTVATVTSVTAIAGALPAGTNLLGKIKTPFFTAVAGTLTRPANQNAYSANEEISATSPASLSVTVSDVNDGPVSLERIRCISTDTGFGGKAIRVWVYNGATTAGTDNATYATAGANFIGTFSGTLLAASDGAIGVLVPDAGSRIVTLPASGAQTLQLRVMTLDAATPSANSTTFIFTVEGFRGG